MLFASEASSDPDRGPVEDMVWIPGAAFRMGSDDHYPEEAPAHRVSVDGFWTDRTPVTNRQFKDFVNATGHVTTAQIFPDAKDYSCVLPEMIYADRGCSRRRPAKWHVPWPMSVSNATVRDVHEMQTH